MATDASSTDTRDPTRTVINVVNLMQRARLWDDSRLDELDTFMDIVASCYNDGDKKEFVHELRETLLEHGNMLPAFPRARLETYMAVLQPHDSELDAEDRLDAAAYWLVMAAQGVRAVGAEDPRIADWQGRVDILRSRLVPIGDLVKSEEYQYQMEGCE